MYVLSVLEISMLAILPPDGEAMMGDQHGIYISSNIVMMAQQA